MNNGKSGNNTGIGFQIPPCPNSLYTSFTSILESNGFKNSSQLVELVQLVEVLPKNQLECIRKSLSNYITAKFQSKQVYRVPVDDRVLSVEQLKKFLNAVSNPKLKFLFKFLALTGLRIGEACGNPYLRIKPLMVMDVNLSECYVRYYPEKLRVNNRIAKVKRSFPKWLVPELKVYIDYFSKSGVLFPNCYVQYRKVFRKACESLGKPFNEYYVESMNGHKLYYFTCHSLRKFHATYIENHSGLGALSINDTESTASQHYISKSERIKAVLDKLEPF